MNKFIGIGRNTKDGEYRTSENGTTMYTNTLAITNDFKNKNGEYDSEFVNYIAYRTTADYLNKYAKKGKLVQIEGRINTTSNEKNGEKRYYTKIIVDSASVLEKVKENKQDSIQEEADIPQNTTSEYKNEESDIQLTDDDLPF
jgi:single-strand DNA-binding protein